MSDVKLITYRMENQDGGLTYLGATPDEVANSIKAELAARLDYGP